MAARQAPQEVNFSLEERAAARTASLTQANEEIQRFAYIVSHDLRSPLVNIMGFTSEMETSVRASAARMDGRINAPCRRCRRASWRSPAFTAGSAPRPTCAWSSWAPIS